MAPPSCCSGLGENFAAVVRRKYRPLFPLRCRSMEAARKIILGLEESTKANTLRII